MNDKFTNNQHDEDIARKLTQIADQTNANVQFAAELEEKLRSAHQPKAGWWLTFHQISPTLRWVGLMVLLAIVLSWSIRTLIPAPQPAMENTPAAPELPTPTAVDEIQYMTPAPGDSILFRGAKLFMNVPLPASPGQANVYTMIESQPATVEYAQSLAQQFGIASEVYLTQGQLPDSTAFMVTDGKQQLVVYAENNFSYTSDMVANSRTYYGTENENAEELIREFLEEHAFNTNIQLVDSSPFVGYIFQQLSPDGLPIEYDNYAQPSVRITLKEDGSVLNMTVVMVSYNPNPLGAFGIITAEEALQRLLDDNISTGKIETVFGGPDENFISPEIWYHEYPDNETVTIYGNVSSNQAVDPSKPAVVFIDSVQAIGNISGLDALDYYTFVQATGQYLDEGGVRKFNVESWSTDIQAAYAFGWARRQGDQIIVVNEDGSGTEYVLVDPPADIPLDITFPDTQMSVNGALIDGQLHWTMITYYLDGSMGGGGGGGGGLGFYQLNLSGTPIPFPTSTPVQTGADYTPAEIASFIRYTVQDGDTLGSIASAYNVSISELNRVNHLSDDNVIAVGWTLIIPGVTGPMQLDGEEGMMQVQIFEKPDGRLREAYTFISKADQTYYQVEGENLKQLQDIANRPIKIWGTISYDEMGLQSLTFERFESLYPDLPFEVLTGTQQNTEIDGVNVVLFTTDGTTYVQITSSGGYPDYSVYEDMGEINLEVLRIPGETYAGYPTVRVFSSGPAVNPTTGAELQLPRVTDKIDVHPDPYGNADTYVPPDLNLESVELIYLTNNPAYPNSENPGDQNYIQPVWHFQGHYSNGDVLDILVQALKEEYLSPELSPHEPPG